VDSAIDTMRLGICKRVVVARLLRCRGGHDEQMSLAQQVQRSAQGGTSFIMQFRQARHCCNS
jgi:hypothetical protein